MHDGGSWCPWVPSLTVYGTCTVNYLGVLSLNTSTKLSGKKGFVVDDLEIRIN